jgi:Circadian oscillating protein COP23
MLSRSISSHLSKICLSLGIFLLVDIGNSQANPVAGNSQPKTIQLLRQILSQNDPEGVDTETNTNDTNTNNTEPNNDRDIIIDDRPTTQPNDEPQDINNDTNNEDTKPIPTTDDTNNEDTKPIPTNDDNKQSRFGCENVSGEYTVMYYPSSQQGQSYPWAIPSQMGGGWTSEKRCGEIARRLELYRPDGLLELSNSRENGYDIICVTTEKDSDCRIVLTVPPGQDPQTTRDRVFQNIITADSGENTTGAATYSEGNSNRTIRQIGKEIGIDLSSVENIQKSEAINLKPFLDRTDGGTGEKLDRSSQNHSRSNQLNPNNFR